MHVHNNILLAFCVPFILMLTKHQPLFTTADCESVLFSGPQGNISWRFFWSSELLSMTMQDWLFFSGWCTCLVLPKGHLNPQSFYVTCTMNFCKKFYELKMFFLYYCSVLHWLVITFNKQSGVFITCVEFRFKAVLGVMKIFSCTQVQAVLRAMQYWGLHMVNGHIMCCPIDPNFFIYTNWWDTVSLYPMN